MLCVHSFTALWHCADKGKKSRFRQLTDLVKSGMSAATSRAKSRTPSRGATQELEAFEAVPIQPPQAAPKSAAPQMPHATALKTDTKSAMPEAPSRRALHDRDPSEPVAEGNSQSSQHQPHPDDLPELAEILAAQPLRSASSAALSVPPPLAPDIPLPTLPISPAFEQHQGSARPVAEGTEVRQPAKISAAAKSSPSSPPVKGGFGFMSGVSTGRGAPAQVSTAHTAAAGAEEASSSQQSPLQTLLPGALAEDTSDLQR